MREDGRRLFALKRAALAALARIGERLLGRALGDADALQPDGEPRIVHHREHRHEPLVGLADEIGDGALAIAVSHRAGRRSLDAELVLNAGAAQIVAAREAPLGVGEELRREEERDSLRALRRVGEPREHEMHDVLGQIVLAIGDEDLLPEEAVGAVRPRLGLGADEGEVRARLRLGQIHGRRPFAGDDFGQEGLFELLARRPFERLHRALAQQRTNSESRVGALPDFRAGGVEEARKTEPAICGVRLQPVPAAPDPIRIGLFPAGRGRDRLAVEFRPEPVSVAIAGGEPLLGEFRGLVQGRLEKPVAEIGEKPARLEGRAARRETRGEENVVEGRAIGHHGFPNFSDATAAEPSTATAAPSALRVQLARLSQKLTGFRDRISLQLSELARFLIRSAGVTSARSAALPRGGR